MSTQMKLALCVLRNSQNYQLLLKPLRPLKSQEKCIQELFLATGSRVSKMAVPRSTTVSTPRSCLHFKGIGSNPVLVTSALKG